MTFRRTSINEEVADYIHKSSTYSDKDGNHPTTDFISADDIINGKWIINPGITPEISKKIIGQAHAFQFNKESILIIK